MNEPWQIQLLGGLCLCQGERRTTRFRTQKTGALLAYLAYHSQQRHSREVLIEMLWPEAPLESGRHNLSHALSSLRSLLEPPGVPAGTVLITDRFTVGLHPDTITTDVAQFEHALRAASQARNTPEYTVLLALAQEKYTGALLTGYYEDWIQPEQERLKQQAEDLAQQLSAQRVPLPSANKPPASRGLTHGLPTGTVTFLLMKTAGSAPLHALTLLRNTITHHGGHLVTETEDTVLAVFGSARDALDGAIASQKAGKALQVRMALHTGDVERHHDAYQGPPLSRAARLLSAAHEGQILCSETTRNLLIRDLEPPITLLPLGSWHLHDFPEPERLFQVCSPEMPRLELPPRNAAPAHSPHLPLQFTRFFGRESEIAQIAACLALPTTRLLTLTGPGGTGKTRLSLEGVGAFATGFEGSIWFVPLADRSDPSLIPTAILQAMSLPLSGRQEPLERVVAALLTQPTLLILDNFEQLIEGGAELVQVLLSRVDSLQCVVTSRQLLGLAGEVEFIVAPLATPNGSDTPERLSLFESVRLFVDRAQAAKPDFRVTNSNAPAVAELCDRLEGIPLAIELAAARALVLSPPQMLAQLSNRFEFLVSRKRGLSERQRTLRATVDWSYRLLTPEVQQFFCQLCVFRGGWSLEAAEAVCEEPLALDMLAQLRECSLITTVESGETIRFRMLETLREYAQGQLSPTELADLHQRHAQFFVALAEQAKPLMTGPEQSLWLDRLEADQENARRVLHSACSETGELEAGLRIVAGYWHLWAVRGSVTEGRKWLNGLFNKDFHRQDAILRAHVLQGSGTLALHEANDTTAGAHLEESLAIFKEQGDRTNTANTLTRLATLADHKRDYPAACALLEEALTLYRNQDDTRGVALAQFHLGVLTYRQGDPLAGQALMAANYPVFREIGDRRNLASALLSLGSGALDQQDYPAAQTYLEESLATYQALGDQTGSAWALLNLGSTALAQGDPTTAQVLSQKSLALFRQWSHPGNITIAIEHLTLISFQLGDVLRAARLWGAAERQREELGWGDISQEFVHHAQAIAAARDALGDDKSFDRAWQEGRALTREQAVVYALDE